MKQFYILLYTFSLIPVAIIGMEPKKSDTSTFFNSRIHFTSHATYNKEKIKHNEEICIHYYYNQNTNQPIISNITSCSSNDVQNIHTLFTKRDIYSVLLQYVDNKTEQPFAFYEKTSHHSDNDKNVKVYEVSPIKFIYEPKEQTIFQSFSNTDFSALLMAFIILILSYKFRS